MSLLAAAALVRHVLSGSSAPPFVRADQTTTLLPGCRREGDCLGSSSDVRLAYVVEHFEILHRNQLFE
jgi:hypothetical protein